MKSRKLFILTLFLLSFRPLLAQQAKSEHELFPFIGFYAADRFQNSLTLGVTYEHHFDDRFALGGSVGIAKAGQNFIQKAGLAAPEQGSATVIYYNGRLTHSFPFGGVTPYAIVGFGVTRQHSESNLTFNLGVGTKFPIGRTTYLRYEINDFIFSSGQDNTSWTNNNLEFAFGVSFYLQ